MRIARVLMPAWLALVALFVAGCSSVVAGSAIKAPGAAKLKISACTEVSSGLATIDRHGPDEPVLRIPQPVGWFRYRQIDSELIRLAIANRDLVENHFAPTVTVTLHAAPGTARDERAALDQERSGLVAMLGATGLRTTPTKVCGYRAEAMTYTAPPIGRIPAREATSLAVVATFDDTMYLATVTIQSTDPRNPPFARDARTILTGFQLLPPDEK